MSSPKSRNIQIFKKLGSKKIEFIGNLKLCELKDNKTIKLNTIQSEFFKSRKVLLTGYSTHQEEEKFCAEVFKNIRQYKKEILILIPRHIERANSINNEMKEKNLIMHRHSSYGKIRKDTDVYLVDTYGEAKKFLGLSKVIFTGGSIIPHGGQNPLDAIRKTH